MDSTERAVPSSDVSTFSLNCFDTVYVPKWFTGCVVVCSSVVACCSAHFHNQCNDLNRFVRRKIFVQRCISSGKRSEVGFVPLGDHLSCDWLPINWTAMLNCHPRKIMSTAASFYLSLGLVRAINASAKFAKRMNVKDLLLRVRDDVTIFWPFVWLVWCKTRVPTIPCQKII